MLMLYVEQLEVGLCEKSAFIRFIRRDNKNKIKISSPGESLALANTQRRVYVPNDIKFEAADHNTYLKTYLIPAVMFDINAPKNSSNKLGNFYDRSVTTILKESVIYPLLAF